MGASMNALNPASLINTDNCIVAKKSRHVIQGNEAFVLADIYHEEVNMAVWQRRLTATLADSITGFLTEKPRFKASMTVSPESALAGISESLGDDMKELSDNIAELVDMFCCLFDLKRVGLRLTVIDSAMCPKFHVDNVPCRLITTFQGAGTEWLSQAVVDRSKLGRGSQGQLDNESGIYQDQQEIQQISAGDVALLKGEHWEGNQEAGIVHRSPRVASGERRLVLTLDFSY